MENGWQIVQGRNDRGSGTTQLPPAVNSKLSTLSSNGIKAMGSDYSELVDPPPAAAAALALPNADGLSDEESTSTSNLFRKARSISVNTISGYG